MRTESFPQRFCTRGRGNRTEVDNGRRCLRSRKSWEVHQIPGGWSRGMRRPFGIRLAFKNEFGSFRASPIIGRMVLATIDAGGFFLRLPRGQAIFRPVRDQTFYATRVRVAVSGSVAEQLTPVTLTGVTCGASTRIPEKPHTLLSLSVISHSNH
ncbi:hypothetical protein EVAR_49227_1 [Eumeta japonica]|uniref:Uncharacterized protein n=1 Tax=Eumeta variegata TaxID=151549 RepID=A0A4C1YGZ0_EUMVA|nr:hypothetical protein EVAR_49227_1 [Eumeta japonica]